MVSFVTGAYILAALLFILALAGLSKHETARRGNAFGMAGMGLALVATLLLVLDYLSGDLIYDRARSCVGLVIILVAGTVGAVIGIRLAREVEMTGMPELIAMMHSFVGLAAVLVGYNTYIEVASIHDLGVDADARPQRRGLHRRLHRRRDLHRLDRRQPQAQREDEVRAADAARPPPAQPGDPRRLRAAAGLVHAQPTAGSAWRRWCS